MSDKSYKDISDRYDLNLRRLVVGYIVANLLFWGFLILAIYFGATAIEKHTGLFSGAKAAVQNWSEEQKDER